MKRIYLLVAAVIALASCKKEEVAPPPPKPGPEVFFFRGDTTSHGADLTVSWSTVSDTVFMNGVPMPPEGSKTFYGMTKDTILHFYARRNGKNSNPASVVGKVRSEAYSTIAGGPEYEYPYGVKWRISRLRYMPAGTTNWLESGLSVCGYFSFNIKGKWYFWRGDCTDSSTDGPGAGGWDLYDNDQRFRWGDGHYEVQTITPQEFVVIERQQTADWETTWERI